MIQRSSKKVIAGFAAIAIFFFHCYLPLGGFGKFMAGIGYIGVDLFFFLSGYSLNYSDTSNLKKYYLNRAKAIIPKYYLFVLLGAIVKSFSLNKILLCLSFISLFQRGGGAFLWYLPAIVLVYLLCPLFKWVKQRYKYKGFVMMMLAYLAAVTIFEYVFHYSTLNILLNRLPIFFIGLYSTEIQMDNKKSRIATITVLLIAGLLLAYLFGYKAKLNQPFASMFYITNIPLSLGIILLLNEMKWEKARLLFSKLGDISMELYGLQMIIAIPIESYILSLTNKTITNILLLPIMIVLSVVYQKCVKGILKL